jgi:cholesterol transport system auxiliary component
MKYLLIGGSCKKYVWGSTSSPRTEKMNKSNTSPFALSLSKGSYQKFCKNLIGVLFFSTLLSGTGCSVSAKLPTMHDFGSPVSISTYKSKRGNNSVINVDAPTWLWDNRIRYRLLYASPTRVGFYTLDLWVAPPPELFEQLLISSGKIQNYSLIIWLQDFEQQFDAPDRARVVLRFSVEAYSDDPNKKASTQEFYLERSTTTPDAAGAVNGFANLTRQAADSIQVWLAGLSDK